MNEAIAAEGMLKLLDEIIGGLEKDLLRLIKTHPASDLEDIQRNYKASNNIAEQLRSKINSGTIARSQLNKEEE